MRVSTRFLAAGVLWIILIQPALSMPVDESEAIDVADLWLAREINMVRTTLDEETQRGRLEALSSRRVRYLSERGDLLDTARSAGNVLAFVVTYEPSGYVVVSGDDEMLPIVAFDSEGLFRWDEPERNFLRYFVQQNMVSRLRALERRRASRSPSVDPTQLTHPMWQELRARLSGAERPDGVSSIDAPAALWELDTAAWNQGWPYNTTVVAHTGGDNSVPTGCTATAMAIKLRYHSWPPSGSGSSSYTDAVSGVNYTHNVNFASQSYSWSAMPTNNLTAANADVADLMYHVGVAVRMDYEPGASGAWLSLVATDTNYRYKGTLDRRSSHEGPMIDSIVAGLPVILSSSDHTVVVDGYRDDLSPYFHINVGWGGNSDGWYNLNQIPGGDSTVDRSYPYSAPSNYMFVDRSWTGSENGNLQSPYNTIQEGYNATPSSGYLKMKSGTYSGSLVMDKPMTVQAYGGSVVID